MSGSEIKSIKHKKVIFITVTRGIIARNILRTKFFQLLRERNDVRIVVLIPVISGARIPEYLFKEIEGANVKIEVVPNKRIRGFERLFNGFLTKLAFTESTAIALQFHIMKSRRKSALMVSLYKVLYGKLSRITWFKRLMRFVYCTIFRKEYYDYYFETYRPDVVFSTSIASQFDVQLIKEAKRRGIKTVSMPKSWDNLHKLFFRIVPDLFLVQNQLMEEAVVELQAISKEKIRVVGFPQFDMYRDTSIISSRESYCKRKNFNPTKPILFFGSEGNWSVGDIKIVNDIIDARKEGRIPDCNILIRPHFGHVKRHPYGQFDNIPRVYIDDGYRTSDFFYDEWDPTVDDMIDFTNSLYHSALLITFASTLALDAVCFDKPIIAVRYGVRYIEGKDRSDLLYKTDHYKWVLQTDGVSLVNSKNELFSTMSKYLKNPEFKRNERKKLCDALCYKVDGRSSDRIVHELIQAVRD